jgi:hypothetical protein
LTKFGNADQDLFHKVRNAKEGERVPMTNGECAEANVKFADDEIDVPTPRGPCYLTKGGNADGGYLLMLMKGFLSAAASAMDCAWVDACQQ